MRPCLERCPDCPSRHLPPEQQKKVVGGIGPYDAEVMLVGEAPGKQEAYMGIPFVGKTGQELDNTYLPLAGLSRKSVYITNTVKCHWADASDAPPDYLVKSCSEFHLKQELYKVRPDVLVLMGGISNGLLGLPLDITALHGTGREGSLWGWRGKIWHTYHPALGMHMGSAMQSLLEDFRKLKLFLRGEIAPLEDEVPNPTYIRLRTRNEVKLVMRGRYDDPIAVDTESRKTWRGTMESVRYIPWCATFCYEAGMAFMVCVEDADAWDEFCSHLKRHKKIIMHNAPHDYRVLLQTGCELDWRCITDTMNKAYICSNLPKGLKPLSYQLLGVEAKGFEDVVRPYGIRAVMEYFERAHADEWPAPVQEWTGEWDTKKCEECKGTGVQALKSLVECEECHGTGYVMGKKKEKKCPKCSGKGVVMTKSYTTCPTCDAGYVQVQRMTRRQGVSQKISRLITDYIKTGDQIDPWSRFANWDVGSRDLIVQRYGYPPMMSVELVPAAEIEDYACTDAHSTKRVDPILDDRMREIRRSYAAMPELQ